MPLPPGTLLGPYRIVSLVGTGGMGEVYRARDPRLERDVAVKVMPEAVAADPDRLERFALEARAVAALAHPNIVSVFDVGTGERPYLVTELLDGETLRQTLDNGPFPVPRAIEVALQLVAGLQAAHGRGIVHRDLKPENVILTPDRGAKILDFGLAKAEAVRDLDVTRPGATLPGVVMGTVGYMSPEQVRGQGADPRSDIFALGAMLYEMLSGQRAFQGASAADTMSAVLKEHPPDIQLAAPTPPALARIIHRCLEKDPGSRFQSVADLRFAIESLSDAQAAIADAAKGEEKSVAVLPFTNLNADADSQFFSDGLAEELTNALGRLPGLKVASRTSAFRFRGQDADIREIGRQLQVRTVLEGSVRRAGQRLRVTAQLVNVADGYHIWSERFDREMADIFDIQDEIVAAIVQALAPALAAEARTVVKRPTENVEAYELYLRGRHEWRHRSQRAVHTALACFQQVIALDPDYALAWAGVGDCYSIMRVFGWYPAVRLRQLAREAVAKALALDPTLAEAHFSQALVAFYFDKNCRKAETHMRRALALNPRRGETLVYLGLVLAAMLDIDEAVSVVRQACALEPLSVLIHCLSATALTMVGRLEEAEREARRGLELQPDALVALLPLITCLVDQGRPEEAVTPAERIVWLSRTPFHVSLLAYANARCGRRDEARRLLSEIEEREQRGEYVPPMCATLVNLGCGDVDGVRRGLQACLDDDTNLLTFRMNLARPLEPLRTDADIDRLCRQFESQANERRFVGSP